jgi:hypothetical protein
MISDLNIDFYSNGVDIDYSRKYNCKENECRDICRCSEIVDIEIKSVDTKVLIDKIYKTYFDNSLETKRDSKLSEILWNIDDDINYYTIDRICRYFKIWENIEVNKEWGYYGEEIESVKISNSEKIVDLINIALLINDLNGRIEFLLGLEYGSLLPHLEKRNWELSEIDVNDIIIRNESHLESVLKKDLKHYDDYRGIKGVVVLTENGKWSLVDGYHRISRSSGKVKILKGY